MPALKVATRSAEPGPVVQTAVTHVIDLDPADWYIATWRRLPPLPRPQPEPFDRDACIGRVAKVRRSRSTYTGEHWDWGPAQVPLSMNQAEARFWLEAMTQPDRATAPATLATALQERDLTTPLTAADIGSRMKKRSRLPGPEIALALWNFLGPDELIDGLLRGDLLGHDVTTEPYLFEWFARDAILTGLRRFVIPYLGPDELDRLRRRVATFAPRTSDRQRTGRVSTRTLLVAALGGAEEIRPIVASWPDGSLRQGCEFDVPFVLFGLDDPDYLRREFARLGADLRRADHVRAWLAHTELSALDVVRDGLLRQDRKEWSEDMLEVFCRVKAPEAAPYLLEIKLNGKSPGLARQWLDEQVGNAVAGLLPIAAGRGKLAEGALHYLRATRSRGFGDLVEEILRQGPAEAAEKVRMALAHDGVAPPPPFEDDSTPEWLAESVSEVMSWRQSKLPDWAEPSRLPPVVVGDRSLGARQVEALLRALHKSKLDDRPALVRQVKEHADPARLDAFAWKLFELWQEDGAAPKDKWAFLAVGLLGGDAAALRLCPLVRAWPTQSLQRRAVLGLDCLRAIGTETALLQLNTIAQKVRQRSVQDKARQAIREIAHERGLSPEQLEDRIAPELGLDAQGGRTFDFGPRQFRLVLDAELKPQVRDEAGKLKKDLPKPGARDDPEKARAAVEAWKLLKQQVRDVVRSQVQRLEQAMVSGRRWTIAEFERYLIHHPLMINFVRRVLWGGYEAGKLVRAFRVTEDGTYADAQDRSCTLEGFTWVGIVHPLHLGEAERAAWGQVLGDYEIIAPFAQLGRRVHTLQPGEESAPTLTRFADKEVPTLLFMGILKSHGWQDGRWQGELQFPGYTKQYPGFGLIACLEQAPGSGDTVRLKEAYFIPDANNLALTPGHAIPLGQVDPVVLSEVIGTLGVVASKGA